MKKELNESISKLKESLSKLNEAEIQYIGLVKSGDKRMLLKKVKLTESKIKGLQNEEEKALAYACIEDLKEVIAKKSLKESAAKVVEFKETVKTLLEAEYYHGEYRTKVNDGKTIKDVVLSVLSEDRENPETVYINFSVPFYPVGASYSDINATVLNLEKRWTSLGRQLSTSVFRGEQGFSGDVIWDASLRTDLIEPGGKVNGNGELAVYLKPNTINAKDEKAFVAFFSPILKKLDSFISTYFSEETDVKHQKEYNKMQGKDDRLLALKSQRKKIKADDSDEASKTKDNFGGMF